MKIIALSTIQSLDRAFLPGDEVTGLGHKDLDRLRELGVIQIEGSARPAAVPTDDAPAAGAAVRSLKGRFDLDPALLQGLSLQHLNTMVAERDSTATAFETVEEAIAFLTSDFAA